MAKNTDRLAVRRERFDPLKQPSGGRTVKEQQWEHCPVLRSRVKNS